MMFVVQVLVLVLFLSSCYSEGMEFELPQELKSLQQPLLVDQSSKSLKKSYNLLELASPGRHDSPFIEFDPEKKSSHLRKNSKATLQTSTSGTSALSFVPDSPSLSVRVASPSTEALLNSWQPRLGHVFPNPLDTFTPGSVPQGSYYLVATKSQCFVHYDVAHHRMQCHEHRATPFYASPSPKIMDDTTYHQANPKKAATTTGLIFYPMVWTKRKVPGWFCAQDHAYWDIQKNVKLQFPPALSAMTAEARQEVLAGRAPPETFADRPEVLQMHYRKHHRGHEQRRYPSEAKEALDDAYGQFSDIEHADVNTECVFSFETQDGEFLTVEKSRSRSHEELKRTPRAYDMEKFLLIPKHQWSSELYGYLRSSIKNGDLKNVYYEDDHP